MLGFQTRRLLQWVMVIMALVVVGLNNETAIVQWTPGDDKAEWHEVRGVWTDKNPEVKTDSTRVNSPKNEWTATRYRSGHFAIEVRACRKWEGKDFCSEWIRSDVNGKPEPWIIFWKPPKPTEFIIEDEGKN